MKSDSIFSLWPIQPYGFEGEGDGANSGEQSNNDGTQQNSQQKNEKTEKTEEDDDPYAGLTPKELRRIAAENASRAETAEAEANTVKTKLTEQERKDLSEKDLAITERDEAKTENATLRATNAKLAILYAISQDQRFTWHNPEIVAAQLDPKEVKVSDEGKVTGLEKALPKIAKDHEYLLKAKAENKNNQQNGREQENNSNNNGNNGNQQGQGNTGFQPGQGGASGGGTLDADHAKLVEHMPALRSRM